MGQALYREWRPLAWSQVVGQEHVVRTLHNAVKGERLSHAYLFSGPRGTGKTSTARILAKAINCLEESLADRPCNKCRACIAVNEGRYLDLIEIDAASNTSVEDVRDLRDRINFAPNEGRIKVYIVDEVHMLSTAAFNALLKTLEEPPPHAIFILATTEIHKVPATVLSRCQRHEFRRIPVDVILGYLDNKVEEGGYQIEAEVLELIARQATGSLRDAISLLDQLVSMGEAVTLERAQEVLGTAVEEAVGDLVQAIADVEIGSGLEIVNQAIDGGIDPRQFARQIVEWLRSLLLISAGEKVEGQSERKLKQARSMGTEGILPAMHAFSQATRGERSAWQPGLALELAFMDAVQSSSKSAAIPQDAGLAPESEPRSGLQVGQDVEDPPNVKGGSEPQVAPDLLTEERGTRQDAVERPATMQRPAEGPATVQHSAEEPRAAQDPAEEPATAQHSAEGSATAQDSTEKPGAAQDPAEGSATAQDSTEKPRAAQDPAEGSASAQDSGAAPGAAQDLGQGRGDSRPDSEFQRVLDAWPDLLAAAYGRDPQTQALLNSCKPLGVDDHSLVLGFQSDLLREKMEKGHSQRIVSEALAEVLKADLDVRCVLLQDWGSGRSAAPSPPLPEGGMVATALRDLGAEVIDYGPEVEIEGTHTDKEKTSNEYSDEEER